ncbi:dedicator of cytokinesis protein 1-like isoform X4 [Mizuhopecten yessoensis]|uniref:dedicator of cytokinesis protein 1-like isoform X4 n=1 Tax=Mizuhopecten yessoensis TaxID=6573 RepID=UPI000B45E6A7|nr:dedicator of cytokinesis protein 1-like isoform X4 [Mizuhopecten yessoensis]
MMQWHKADRSRRYGVAVYNFHLDRRPCLKLSVGESVHILEETEGWYWGYTTRNKNQRGVFPKTYVHIKEAAVLTTGSLETIAPKELPLSQEINSVLREWHVMWKQYFVERNQDFGKIMEMMQELIHWRRKIMSRKLTAEELRDLQQKISSKIDLGNDMLGLDLVVRDDQGNVLDPESTSAINLFKQHELAADRIKAEKVNTGKEEGLNLTWPHTFNLFVKLRNFVCRIGEDADILMSLYDAKFGKFISENYVVKWAKGGGVPKNLEMLNNYKVVFTDLGAKDRQREKVFLVFQIVRIGVMDTKDVDDKKQTKGLKRPFGVAALDITEIMNGKQECSEETQHFIPFQQCGEKEAMESLIRKVVVAKDINHKGQGVWVSMKILSGDPKQVREDFPHLVGQNTPVSRKMGFPEVIMPGDVRNDIYITIKQGEFTRGPTKTADKNVEVTMVVCNKNLEKLKAVISHGCGGELMTEYRTMVYYHEDKPKWYETVKVAISTEEEFRGLHLKFLFKHKSTSENKDRAERPFAMSFVKLMNKNHTTLADTDHNLLVYKIERKHDDSDPYLDLPSTRDVLDSQDIQKGSKIPLFSGPFTLNQRDSFMVNTFVCSTKLTHNVDLLGLLKWQEMLNDTSVLRTHLDKLMHVDGEEIVKFLQDLLDSLFNILIETNISEMYDNLVFEALVHIIGLISDRKYHQFRPVLDAYVTTSFSFAMAYEKLMLILRDYVDRAMEVNQKVLIRAMKSLEYLFKFIVQSRNHFSVLNDGRGKQLFELQMKQLIQAISGMMLYTSDNTLLAQGSALKYLCSAIPDIMHVFDPLELSKLMVEFINNVPKERLTKQKLKCIDDLVYSVLFKSADCRAILLPMILKHTGPLLEDQEELEDCVNVLSNVMDQMHDKSTGPHSNDIGLIMKENLRIVIRSAVCMDKTSKEARRTESRCVAVLMSILRKMTENHYLHYIREFSFLTDLQDFLMEILTLFQVLIKENVFARDWLAMIMLQNSIILRALRFFAQTICEKFTSSFEEQLWSCFFHCAIAFLTQRHLQLEQFSVSKRNKIVSRYSDMRREMGFEIRQMWSRLGVNKKYFIPTLVEPILEMTLVPELELRKATIPIFFDMMQCEFTQVDPVTRKIKGNFDQTENELIMKLDALVEGGYGDEEYMDLIYDILHRMCNGNDGMRQQGLAFVDVIKRLLQRLLEYRKIIQYESKEHRMNCIVNLLNFYHDIDRQEMYIRYLYKLCDLHIECDNYTEAANTLMLHVNLLQWSDDNLPLMLQSNWYPNVHTHRGLKEMLYYDIISYFDKGKMWEKGILLCKELVHLYESELFDYERLSVILRRQADLYSCIIKELRADPEYFRVGYFGRGFPAFVQNKVFIYRGKEYERLSDFNARMLSMFPNAEILKSLSPPTEDMKESKKQFLQVNAVTPVLELKDRFVNKPVSERILKYYNVNEVTKFMYSRRMDESNSDITKMWLERTTMVSSHSLPGILCWFPVVTTTMYQVSPLENAIETLDATNKKINLLIEQHTTDPTQSASSLGMLLNGVVDASVNGGITNFKIFYSDDYGESEKDMNLVIKLKELTCNQMILLREALNIHKKKVTDDLKPFHLHMEQRFEEMCNLIKQEYSLKPPESAYMSTLKRYKSMSAVSLSRVSEAFLTMPSESNYPASASKTIQPASRSPSVWVKGDKSTGSPSPSKGLQKVSNLGIFKRTSVAASSDHSSEGSNSNRNSLEVASIIELNEQELTFLSSGNQRRTRLPSYGDKITPKRPLRPENNEKRQSRTYSNQFKTESFTTLNISTNSLASNNTDTNSSSDQEQTDTLLEPPQLPEKHNTCSDYSNLSNDIPELAVSRNSSAGVPGHRKSKNDTNHFYESPLPSLPKEEDLAPPPVPKKHTTPKINNNLSVD